MAKNKEWHENMMEYCHPTKAGGGGAVYGLGVIGALVYFVQHASGVSEILMGVVKAIVWPALLVFRALVLLKM